MKQNVKGGYLLTCIGDERNHSLLLSKYGNSISKSNMVPCIRDILESKNSHRERCYLESKKYSPKNNYLNALEISNEYLFINEIMSSKDSEDIQLIINY